jgi:hypothetical protein
MDKAQATNAPFPLQLGDLKLEMRALRDGDIGALDNWVRSEYVHSLRATLTGLSQAERDESLRVIFQQAAKMHAFENRGAALLATPMGLAKLVQVSCDTKEPIERIHKLMFDVVNVSLVQQAFMTLNPVIRGNAAGRAQGPASSMKVTRTRASRSRTR